MYTKAIALIAALTSVASAQNSFNYQGSLRNAGLPANGSYDLRFTLWTDATPGDPDVQIGSENIVLGASVVDGLFSVSLDLDDSAFQTQDARYLQIEVRLAGDPEPTILSPRQAVDFAPRAIHALTAGEAKSIELPYSGTDALDTTSGSVFEITNTGTKGTAIRANSPVWGIRAAAGTEGITTPYLVAPVPVGILGVGNRTGIAGSSLVGSGIWGKSRDGIGGEFCILLDHPGDALPMGPGTPGSSARPKGPAPPQQSLSKTTHEQSTHLASTRSSHPQTQVQVQRLCVVKTTAKGSLELASGARMKVQAGVSTARTPVDWLGISPAMSKSPAHSPNPAAHSKSITHKTPPT